MNVILLCAGYATRLYPLTKDCAKPLLLVDNKPIVEYILQSLNKISSVEMIYIITNDKFSEQFTKWSSELDYHTPIEVLNDRTTSNDDRLGAIGDIAFTLSNSSIDSDVLVIGGDNLFDLDLNMFCQFAARKAPYVSLAVYDVKEQEEAKKFGLVTVDDAKQVTEFVEKPENPPTTLASLALYYYPKESLSLLRRYIDEGNNTDQPGHYIRWLVNNYKVFAYSFDGTWYDVGDIKSLETADKFYRNRREEKK